VIHSTSVAVKTENFVASEWNFGGFDTNDGLPHVYGRAFAGGWPSVEQPSAD
jgi:hypothetical protein